MIQLLDFTFVGGRRPKAKRFPQFNAFLLDNSEWLKLSGECFISARWSNFLQLGVSTSEFDSNAMGYMLPVDPTGEISVSMCMGSIYIINYFVPRDT